MRVCSPSKAPSRLRKSPPPAASRSSWSGPHAGTIIHSRSRCPQRSPGLAFQSLSHALASPQLKLINHPAAANPSMKPCAFCWLPGSPPSKPDPRGAALKWVNGRKRARCDRFAPAARWLRPQEESGRVGSRDGDQPHGDWFFVDNKVAANTQTGVKRSCPTSFGAE
jgi:hypothetical protein